MYVPNFSMLDANKGFTLLHVAGTVHGIAVVEESRIVSYETARSSFCRVIAYRGVAL